MATTAAATFTTEAREDSSDDSSYMTTMWVILKTYVSLALHSNKYETRLKYVDGGGL